MKATTIKLEGSLLKGIETVCPPSKTLTAFVREVLNQDLRRRRMAKAAAQYEAFLSGHPDERDWLSHWEKVPLTRAPGKSRRRKS